MVKTSIVGREPTWVSHWVTVVPVYSTSVPQRMRCMRKKMILYDGHNSRKPMSFIDLKGARAELTSDQCAQVTLDVGQTQPANVSSFKTENDAWCFTLNTTVQHGLESLNRLIFAVNHSTETIIEQSLTEHQRQASDTTSPAEAFSPNAASLSFGHGLTLQPHLPLHESHLDIDTRDRRVHFEDADVADSQRSSANEDNINDGICVVCLDRPHNAGFLHAGSIHRCVCLSCAFLIYLSDRSRCPICRQTIERVISDKRTLRM